MSSEFENEGSELRAFQDSAVEQEVVLEFLEPDIRVQFDACSSEPAPACRGASTEIPVR